MILSVRKFLLVWFVWLTLAGQSQAARLWRQATDETVILSGFRGKGFSLADKVFGFFCRDAKAIQDLQISIAATDFSPLVNPAFVLANQAMLKVRFICAAKDFYSSKRSGSVPVRCRRAKI